MLSKFNRKAEKAAHVGRGAQEAIENSNAARSYRPTPYIIWRQADKNKEKFSTDFPPDFHIALSEIKELKPTL